MFIRFELSPGHRSLVLHLRYLHAAESGRVRRLQARLESLEWLPTGSPSPGDAVQAEARFARRGSEPDGEWSLEEFTAWRPELERVLTQEGYPGPITVECLRPKGSGAEPKPAAAPGSRTRSHPTPRAVAAEPQKAAGPTVRPPAPPPGEPLPAPRASEATLRRLDPASRIKQRFAPRTNLHVLEPV